jgi:hypothetical protein
VLAPRPAAGGGALAAIAMGFGGPEAGSGWGAGRSGLGRASGSAQSGRIGFFSFFSESISSAKNNPEKFCKLF